MNFVNRNKELGYVQNTMDTLRAKSDICFSTCNASGFTSFCKKVEALYDNDIIMPIYVDGADTSGYTVYTHTFEKIWKTDKKKFNKYLSQYSVAEPGSVARDTGALIAGVPFFGNLLGEPFKQLGENTKFVLQRSYLQETLIKLILSISSKRKILFLIDNAHLLDSWSTSLIENIEDANAKTTYIFGQCVQKGQEENGLLFNKLISKGRSVSLKDFDAPDLKFVKEISNHIGKIITNDDALDLIYESEGNLYKILARLKNTDVHEEALSEVQKSILKLLSVCSQPIRKTDILALVTNLPDHYIQSEEDVLLNLDKLRQRGDIFETRLPDGDALFKMKSYTVAKELIDQETDGNRIFLQNHVYEFYRNVWKYSIRHSKSEIAQLLYRLAKIISASSVHKHALDIIKISFALGTFEQARQFMNEILDVNNPTDETEYYLSINFNIAYRNYDPALSLLRIKHFAKFRKARFYAIAEAICLERKREYSELWSFLDKKLRSTTVNEEAVLRVYQINSLVHSNKIVEAREIFEAALENLKDAHAFPYILRTATSIFNPDKSQSFLIDSIKHFKDIGDDFGYATSLANLGALKIETQNYTEAIKLLKESKSILNIFGIHHLNIVENSLGLALLFLKSFSDAKNFFKKGLNISKGEMAQLYFNINLSIADALNGEFDEAINRLLEFEEFVKNYPVDRVRQKFYCNLASIMVFGEASVEETKRVIREMERFPDRKNPNDSLRLAEKIKSLYLAGKNIKIEIAYFSPCYLEYWYSNPLADLSRESLPEEALI